MIAFTKKYDSNSEKWLNKLKKENQIFLVEYDDGWSSELLGLQGNRNLPWFQQWTRARQKMLVSPQPSESPNILFLDAEERRWVTPKHGLGEIRPENMEQRWLSSYRATENWDGQVESALLTMKIASDERFSKLVDNMNGFLSGKEILKEVILV